MQNIFQVQRFDLNIYPLDLMQIKSLGRIFINIYSIIYYLLDNMEPQNQPIEFHYWNIRGAAQPIRHLLEYLKLQYKQKIFQYQKRWFGNQIQQLKKKCVFLSLPYINDNGFIISEIVPMAKYLCKKANRKDLLGKTVQDQVKIDELLVKFIRNRNKMFQLWNKGVSNVAESQKALIQKKNKVYSQFMNENYFNPVIRLLEKGTWILGYLTIADFFVYESCFYVTGIYPQLICNFKCVQEFKLRFQEIKQIKEYNQSERSNLKIFIIPNLNLLWKGNTKYI